MKGALIQIISNKHIFKVLLIITFPSIKMGTGSEQRIYTVYVRIREPDSFQDDSVESCLSACSNWFTVWRFHGKWDSQAKLGSMLCSPPWTEHRASRWEKRILEDPMRVSAHWTWPLPPAAFRGWGIYSVAGMLGILGWLSRHSNWHGALHAPKTFSSVFGIQWLYLGLRFLRLGGSLEAFYLSTGSLFH